MPWKEINVMDSRREFVMRLEAGARMTDVCREYGISRKTGYKFLKRFKAFGEVGLADQSRRPHHVQYAVSEEMKARLLALKEKHPTWGAKKLRAYLQRVLPDVQIPVPSTIHNLLNRHGLVRRRKARKIVSVYPHRLRSSESPNQVWCADFKGQFRLGNGRMCYPLTITDHFSRKILGCVALHSIDTHDVHRVFQVMFDRYGVPEAIRTDNGAPFASRALAGLSRLSVWWLSLGIVPERIERGHPEQNGRHERMHRTLKAEATRPASANLLAQQERFDSFVEEFNTIRPHEALEMQVPDAVYQPSPTGAGPLPAHDVYALDDLSVVVGHDGRVRVPQLQLKFFISTVLEGQAIGLRELQNGRWLVSFMRLSLGHFHPDTHSFQPMETYDYTQIISQQLLAVA